MHTPIQKHLLFCLHISLFFCIELFFHPFFFFFCSCFFFINVLSVCFLACLWWVFETIEYVPPNTLSGEYLWNADGHEIEEAEESSSVNKFSFFFFFIPYEIWKTQMSPKKKKMSHQIGKCLIKMVKEVEYIKKAIIICCNWWRRRRRRRWRRYIIWSRGWCTRTSW